MIWSKQSGSWTRPHWRNSAASMEAIIVGNGPSLNAVDVTGLAGPGRVVIAMNSAYPKVRPDYWIGMDTPDNYSDSLWDEVFPKILRSGTHNREAMKSLAGNPGVHFMDFRGKGSVFDCLKEDQFRWFQDTFRAAIQLAMFLGCDSIGFAGVDLDSSTSYADGDYLTPAQKALNSKLYDEQYTWLKEFVPAAEKVGILCFSISPKSRINGIMPEKSVEDLKTPRKDRRRVHSHAPSPECNEYDALVRRDFKPYSLGHQAMYRTVCELLRGTKSDVLEIGFGIGYGIEQLLEAHAVGKYAGCEPCKDSFEYVSKKQIEGVRLKECGWADMGGEADYVLCIEVFEHLPRSERLPFLEAVRKQTRKALFLSSPDSEHSAHGVVTEREMLDMLNQSGFRAVALRPQWTTLYIAT